MHAPTERGGAGRILARVAGIGALIVAVVLAAIVLLGGDSGHQYKLMFESGGQLVAGNQVLVGGEPIGTIDNLDLTDDAQAEVTVTVDQPLHEGTTAVVRSTSLSGIANRYISISPGSNSEPELDDGAVITADKTTAPVDLDQLFNTFDHRTKAGLRDLIKGYADVYTGNNDQARATYKYFAPSLQESDRLFAELSRDQDSLSRFLVEGSKVFGALAERRDDLSALTENGNRALGAIADANQGLDRTLVALAPAMRQANTTFVNLRAALDDLDPLIADTGRVAPDLAPFLRRLRPVARASVPVFSDLTTAISRDGPNNDLTESLQTLPGAQRSADSAVPRALEALASSQHLVEFARPYSPDLLALVGKLGGTAGYYDLNGHYIRAQPAGGNVFDYNETTGELEAIPPSQQYDAYGSLGIGPFTRCPGGSTQANLGWPAPTDHPFLDDGNLAGDCDPNDVPPGP